MHSIRFAMSIIAAIALAGAAAHADEYGVRQGLVSISGSTSLAIQHSVDDPDDDNSVWSLAASVGYFVIDPLSLDVIGSFAGNFDDDDAESLHFAGTVHFMPRQMWTPYLQGGLGFAHVDSSALGIDDTEGSYLVGGGLKFFVAENISINADIRYLALFDFADDGFMSYGLGFGLYF